eukprot:gene757-821_t
MMVLTPANEPIPPSYEKDNPTITTNIHSNNNKSKTKDKVALKTRYIRPADIGIPSALHLLHPHPHLQHHAIPIINNQLITAQLAAQAQRIIEGPQGEKKTELDGFYLLEVAAISFPEDVQQINLSDRHLLSVIEEDLPYFTELLYLDLSENRLPLSPFGALPQLRELRMVCNHLQQIDEITGFQKLLFLDLSYNSINLESIIELTMIPILKELDLSGNGLHSLPMDLSAFQYLEKIVLEYNKLDDNNVFLALASLPNIRHVDVSHNYLSVLPTTLCHEGGFSREDDLRPLLEMPRLLRVLLYGNPVLGPTGEDPLFSYIEDLVEDSVRLREETQSRLPDVEFVTEMPRKRLLKKGQPLGRFALYRDFAIVQVDSGSRELTAKQWKAKGKATLFGEAMAARKLPATAAVTVTTSASVSALPDLTFITNSIAATNIAAMHMTTSSSPTAAGAAAAAGGGFKGSGGMDIDAIADNVMAKVALEMGLVQGEELQAFARYAHLPPTVFELQDRQQQQQEEEQQRKSEEEEDMEQSRSRLNSEASSRLDSEDHTQHEGEGDGEDFDDVLLPHDHVPGDLFGANLQETLPKMHGQPIALRTAMKALQRALDQPLTDYNSVPASWSLGGHDHARPTASSKLRQLPRIPIGSGKHGGNGGDEEDRWDRRSQRYQRRGLAEPVAAQKMRQETRQRTLGQLNTVLDQLNLHTQNLREQQDAFQQQALHFSGPNHPQGNGNEVPPMEEEAKQSSASHIRQSMEQMRTFAHQPKSGVSKLMNMVHNIVEEFNR